MKKMIGGKMVSNEQELSGLREKKFQEIDAFFRARSIAVVGVSEEGNGRGTSYLLGLHRAGYRGKIFAVGRGGGNVAGYSIYRGLRDVPEPIDYVSVFIPREGVLDLLEECRGKGIKGMQLFTAGFSELDEEGEKLEKATVKKAREVGIRIIGPNCVGLSSPKYGMSYSPMGVFGEEGNVAFLSQSGGFGTLMYNYGTGLGLGFSKVISFGNGADLDAVDFLEYLLMDPDTKVIGAYFEGARRGRELLTTLKEVTRKKPLVIWKGGRTKEGRETAFSHTASLSSSPEVWNALIKQVGAVEVGNMKEMAATLLAFQNLPPLGGRNVAVLAGLMAAGGGMSVASSDVLAPAGLQLPALSESLKAKIQDAFPRVVGTIIRNPIDLGGSSAGLEKTLEILSEEGDFDLIMFWVPLLLRVKLEWVLAEWSKAIDILVEFKRQGKVPLAGFMVPGTPNETEAKLIFKLRQAGIAVFPDLETGASAISHLISYYKRKEED